MNNTFLTSIEPLHQYEEDIHDEIHEDVDSGFKDDLECSLEQIGDHDDNDLYDLSNFSFDKYKAAKPKPTDMPSKRPEPHTPEYYLEKASYAYDTFKYKKCLDYIHDYEVRINQPTYEKTLNEKVIALAYRAYCKKALKKYSSAKDYFAEMISIFKKDPFLSPECLFMTYFQHASCYAHMGKMGECEEKIRKIANMDFGLSIDYLVKKDYIIHRQPCFHYHKFSTDDKFVINEILATALGNDILTQQKQGKLIPGNCHCGQTNESKEFCAETCKWLVGIGELAASFIPHIPTRIAVMIAIIKFDVECERCCEEGFGSENCCKGLKSILEKVSQATVTIKV